MVDKIGKDIGWLRITQHIRYGLTPLPFGTLLPSVATSYMLGTLSKIGKRQRSTLNPTTLICIPAPGLKN